MFTIVDHTKRRLWSTRTVAVSVGVHLLVLTGVAVAANAHPAPEPPPPVPPDTIWFPTEETSPSASETTKPQPRVQAEGGFVPLPAPETELDSLPPVDSTATPLTEKDVTGLGQELVWFRPHRDSTPRPPAPDPPLRDYRIDEPEEHEQIPQLANPHDVQRILMRMYPPMLRDRGVAGRTTVVLVVDGTGAVVPGSVTVRETSHEGFRDAAIRAAERFRFRPAGLNGQTFAAVVTLPIEWKVLR
jgi:TonB family protein